MRQTVFLFFPLFLGISLAYFFQSQFQLNSDVGYLLVVAKQILHGGQYGIDIFETNPPIILYLYSPILFLSNSLGLSVEVAVRLYILMLVALSVLSCFYLWNKIIDSKDRFITYFLTYILLFIYLILPVSHFGQREHLLILFIMPYIFSAVLRSQNKSIPLWQGFIIGLFAGLGFGIKPFFLVTPVLIELYLVIRLKTIKSLFRIEPIVIFSVLVFYLFFIFIFQTNYIKVLLPLITKYYFEGNNETWINILSYYRVDFSIAVLLIYPFILKQDRYRDISIILWLASLGMMVAYLIPGAPWFYHTIPALCFSSLLIAVIFSQVVLAYINKTQGILSYIRDAFFLFFGILILFLEPIGNTLFLSGELKHNRKVVTNIQLIEYVKSLPKKQSVFCFSSNTTADCFPLVYETQSEYGTRFPFFWWMRSILTQETNQKFPPNFIDDKNFLIEQVAFDLDKFQPKLVIVNLHDNYFYISPHFDVVNYFLKNEKFKLAWQHYRFLTKINYYKIYQRIS